MSSPGTVIRKWHKRDFTLGLDCFIQKLSVTDVEIKAVDFYLSHSSLKQELVAAYVVVKPTYRTSPCSISESRKYYLIHP